MLRQFFQPVKTYRASTADPEGRVLRIAIRTAVACLLSIVLFQWTGHDALIGWAAFAALGFSQIDTLDLLSKRVIYLLANIVLFAALALLGISLSDHWIWFLISIPIVIFICGYAAAFGPQYFNAGGWAGFLYVAFGSSIGTKFYAAHVALTFVVIGILCLLISVVIFPERPLQRILTSSRRILTQLGRARQPSLETLLALHNHTVETYLKAARLTDIQHQACLAMRKSLYQVFLMMKNIEALQPRVSSHTTFAQTGLAGCHPETVEMVGELLDSRLRGNDTSNGNKILEYRAQIKAIQLQELEKAQPDFASLLDYSSYLYHFIQLWELLANVRQHYQQLQGAGR